jgi:hypothetical protein
MYKYKNTTILNKKKQKKQKQKQKETGVNSAAPEV